MDVATTNNWDHGDGRKRKNSWWRRSRKTKPDAHDITDVIARTQNEMATALQTCTQTNSQLLKRLSAAEDEMVKLNQQNRELVASVKATSKGKGHQTKHLTEAENQSKQLDDELKDVKLRMRDKDERHKNLVEKLRAMDADRKQIHADFERVSGEENESRLQCIRLKDYVEKLSIAAKELKEKCSSLEEDLSTMSKNCLQAKEERSMLVSSLDAISNERTEWRSKSGQMATLMESMKKENTDILAKSNVTKVNLKKEDIKRQMLEVECQRLQEELKSLTITKDREFDQVVGDLQRKMHLLNRSKQTKTCELEKLRYQKVTLLEYLRTKSDIYEGKLVSAWNHIGDALDDKEKAVQSLAKSVLDSYNNPDVSVLENSRYEKTKVMDLESKLFRCEKLIEILEEKLQESDPGYSVDSDPDLRPYLDQAGRTTRDVNIRCAVWSRSSTMAADRRPSDLASSSMTSSF